MSYVESSVVLIHNWFYLIIIFTCIVLIYVCMYENTKRRLNYTECNQSYKTKYINLHKLDCMWESCLLDLNVQKNMERFERFYKTLMLSLNDSCIYKNK